MAELGDRSCELHRLAGEAVQTAGVEHLLTIGVESKIAAEGFGKGARHFERVEELIDTTQKLLGADVTCLVKGSRSAGMERVADALTDIRS